MSVKTKTTTILNNINNNNNNKIPNLTRLFCFGFVFNFCFQHITLQNINMIKIYTKKTKQQQKIQIKFMRNTKRNYGKKFVTLRPK